MEATPAKRLDTQEVERIGSNAYALETLGPLVSRIQDIEIVDADYVFKSVRFAPQLHEFRRGVRTAPAGPAALQIVDLHGNYALGLPVWEGFEEHVFDDAKNSRGGSDSETQSDNGHGDKARLFPKPANTIADILLDARHARLRRD